MFDWGGSTRQRVSRLEDGFTELRADVGGLGGKIDKLVEGLSSTDNRAGERAQNVKTELRDETDRKSKERTAAAMIAFGLLSAIALIVAALTGPWKEKLESTASGQSADTVAIAAVREVIAQQGAGIGRTQAAIDIMRENNRIRDAEMREHDQDIAFAKGVAAARNTPTR